MRFGQGSPRSHQGVFGAPVTGILLVRWRLNTALLGAENGHLGTGIPPFIDSGVPVQRGPKPAPAKLHPFWFSAPAPLLRPIKMSPIHSRGQQSALVRPPPRHFVLGQLFKNKAESRTKAGQGDFWPRVIYARLCIDMDSSGFRALRAVSEAEKVVVFALTRGFG